MTCRSFRFKPVLKEKILFMGKKVRNWSAEISPTANILVVALLKYFHMKNRMVLIWVHSVFFHWLTPSITSRVHSLCLKCTSSVHHLLFYAGCFVFALSHNICKPLEGTDCMYQSTSFSPLHLAQCCGIFAAWLLDLLVRFFSSLTTFFPVSCIECF